MSEILSIFHHIHHKDGKHEVHHCGGKHNRTDSRLNYEIKHCHCGKHSIDRKIATGHTVSWSLKIAEIAVEFLEKCPDGGWHVESGVVIGPEDFKKAGF